MLIALPIVVGSTPKLPLSPYFNDATKYSTQKNKKSTQTNYASMIMITMRKIISCKHLIPPLSLLSHLLSNYFICLTPSAALKT